MKLEVLFITGVNQIKLSKTSSNGERFLDRFYITNDHNRIERLIGPHQAHIGSVEYNYLRGTCSALIYSHSTVEVEQIDTFHSGLDSVMIPEILRVQGFLEKLWLVRDNAAYQDRAWLVATGGGQATFHTNNWNVRHTTSSGGYDYVSFTPDQLREARALCGGDVQYLRGSGHPTSLVSTSLRFQRFMYFIQMARSSPDVAMKIAQYCSGIEALVSSAASELTHQVAERVACLLEPPTESRLALFRRMKEAYGFRSRAAHGAGFRAKAFDELRTISSYIDDVCRQLATLYIENQEGIRESLEGGEEEFNDFFQRRIFCNPGRPS